MKFWLGWAKWNTMKTNTEKTKYTMAETAVGSSSNEADTYNK